MTNQEIDAAVAVKLGYVFDENAPDRAFPWIEPYKSRHTDLPSFTTDIKAAWEVLEDVASRGYEITFANEKTGGWHVEIGEIDEDAETAPLAICRAFLAMEEK